MSRQRILTVVTVLLILPAASTLRADHAQAVGRYLGVGWGDGYHSRTACPPKRHILHVTAAAMPNSPPAKPLPWWMIPADSPENLPPPHEETPSTSAPGASLFRQPGDGSSVHPPASPSIMR
jgi:hypothetical protein